MILYKKEPFPLQMKNIMLIDDPSTNGCIYLSKQTYDQAIILASRLDNNPERVLTMLIGTKFLNYGSVPGMSQAIKKAMAEMPTPINCLAPFLLYCMDNQGVKWEDMDIVMMYGILHQFSQIVDFNAITLVPAEVRANITLPTAIVMQYEASWDDLCSSLKDKVVMTAREDKVEKSTTSVKSTPKSESVKVEEPEDEDDEDEEDDIDWDALQAKLQAIKDAPAANGQVPEYKASTPAPAPAPAPVVTPAPVPAPAQDTLVQSKNEAAAASKVLDEYNF